MTDAAASRAEFAKIAADMVADMTLTFPEHANKWIRWSAETLDAGSHREYVEEMDGLAKHCYSVCISNADLIRDADPALFSIPAEFLPGVDFGELYNCAGVSQSTKDALWKYIQLMLVLAERAESISVIQTSITDAAEELQALFLNRTDAGSPGSPETAEDGEGTKGSKGSVENPTFKTNAGFEKSQSSDLDPAFLDGKLGRIAQSIAGELGSDFAELAGDLSQNPTDIAGFMARLMRNPSKISALVKTVSGKLTEQVGNGNITSAELMAETSQFMSHMGGGAGGAGGVGKAGGANFGDILGGLMQTMNAGGGLRENDEPKRKKLTWKEKVKLRAEKKRADNTLAAAETAQGKLPALSDEMLIAAFEDITPPKKTGKRGV